MRFSAASNPSRRRTGERLICRRALASRATHGYLDTLGYLKKGSIAHTGYFAILWYCTYQSMCNTRTSAVLRILDTVLRIPDTSTLDHTSRRGTHTPQCENDL